MDLGREPKAPTKKGDKVSPYVAQVAEGKTYDFLPVSTVKQSELKYFLFDSPNQHIITEMHEFIAVCPFSGATDIAKLKIEYFPTAGRVIELKSLKYYCNQWKNVGSYQENCTKIIYRHLKNVLKTNRLRVETVYNVRGGFLTTAIEGKL